MNDDQAYIARRQLFERFFKRFGGTLQIGFDDNLEFHNLALVDRIVEVVERNFFDVLCVFKPLKFLPLKRNVARRAFGVGNLEGIAGIRHSFQAENFNRHRRSRFVDFLPEVVKNCTHAAGINTGNVRISGAERSALDDNRRDNAAPVVYARFYNLAFGTALPIRLQFENFGLQQYRV